jgi:hypothetical protein
MALVKSIFLSLVLAATTFVLPVSKAQASPILIVDNGQLLGANNIDINGSIFDVRFIDGVCADLFGGVCSRSNFTFQTQADGISAAAAIVDQIFNSVAGSPFDIDPELIFGCTNTISCQILIPINIFPGLLLNSAVVGNSNGPGAGAGATTNIRTGDSLALDARRVFASFTPSLSTSVPEPSVIVMLLGGILGLGVLRRKQKQKAVGCHQI